MRSTADWLSWQTGIGLNAGREQVRVARALRELPLVAAEFGAGRLSYSKARALTRIATAESEVDLVQMAEHATAAQIENFVAATRRAIRASDVRARRKASYLQWHQDDDGSIVGSFRLSPEQGAPFCHAVDAGTGKLVDLIGEGDPGEDKAARQRRSAAEVLGLMAEAFLRDVSAETSTEGAERYQLVLHTTAEELAMRDDADADADDDGAGTVVAGGNGRQWRVAPSTALRLTCDCPASTMVDGPDGHALHLGRKTRRIRGPLRRAVHARDRGMCGAPGCTQRATQIHHVRHWAHGGPTCLRNLISLCDGHHWRVHEGGFTIVPRSEGGWVLMSLDGVRVGPTPVPPEAVEPLPVNPDIADDAVAGHWDGTKMNTVYAVGTVLGLQVPKRQSQTRSTVLPRTPIEEAISAETWEMVMEPIRDDYPGEPWVGYDDPFFG